MNLFKSIVLTLLLSGAIDYSQHSRDAQERDGPEKKHEKMTGYNKVMQIKLDRSLYIMLGK